MGQLNKEEYCHSRAVVEMLWGGFLGYLLGSGFAGVGFGPFPLTVFFFFFPSIPGDCEKGELSKIPCYQARSLLWELALQKAGLMPTPESEGRMWRLKGFGCRVEGLGLRDV